MRFLAFPWHVLVSVAGVLAWWVAVTPAASARPEWVNGLPNRTDYFPIAVWLQEPRDAANYKAIGVNLYVGLWDGPTEEQLAALEKAGMPVICDQDAVARRNLNRKIIVGWMHGDEPDNAQELPGGKGYRPPIAPAAIVAEEAAIKKVDPTRPVMLNLGQGVAWDGWFGRGVRTNKPQDYPQYIKGGDIISFDIYPATHPNAEVAGKLWMVANGVQRLVKWSGGNKIVWNCIETTHVDNPTIKPTPRQVRAEVWMSIIAGSRGIIYFCHEFAPTQNSRALLSDRQMSAAVKKINAEVTSLATAINAPVPRQKAMVKAADTDVPISLMTREVDKTIYVFTVAMRDKATGADFDLASASDGAARVEVLGENRTLPVMDGHWKDHFDGYDVHLYRITRK